MASAWGAVWQYVSANKLSLLSLGGLAVSAGVKTLPLPGQPFRVYTWVYDWMHQFLNVTNTRLTQGQVVTPPAASPEKVS